MARGFTEQELYNLSIVGRLFTEVWNQKRSDVLPELFHLDVISHYAQETMVGLDEWRRRIFVPLTTAIPDLSVTAVERLPRQDLVVSRWKARGVQRGECFGCNLDGQEVSFSGISWVRIVHGKIAEKWARWSPGYQVSEPGPQNTEIPILATCQHCYRVRLKGQDERNMHSWVSIETYLRSNPPARLSHGICPECLRKHYGKEVYQIYMSGDDRG